MLGKLASVGLGKLASICLVGDMVEIDVDKVLSSKSSRVDKIKL